MTVLILTIVGGVLMAAGALFMIVAAMGFVRLPDVFCRLHVTGILDTLGAPLVLLGAAVWMGWSLNTAKLLMGIVFLFVTSPLVGHLLSRAAFQARQQFEAAERLQQNSSDNLNDEDQVTK